MPAYYERITFIVASECDSIHASGRCPLFDLVQLLELLKLTGWICFVSPLHSPEISLEHDECKGMYHYHIVCDTGARLSKSSVLKKLVGFGIPAINMYFERVRDFKSSLLYLTHRTFDALNKQQFPEQVQPILVNAPQSYYSRSLSTPYFSTIRSLIDDYQITSEKHFLNLVEKMAPEYLEKAFKDMAKWSRLFYYTCRPDEPGESN